MCKANGRASCLDYERSPKTLRNTKNMCFSIFFRFIRPSAAGPPDGRVNRPKLYAILITCLFNICPFSSTVSCGTARRSSKSAKTWRSIDNMTFSNVFPIHSTVGCGTTRRSSKSAKTLRNTNNMSFSICFPIYSTVGCGTSRRSSKSTKILCNTNFILICKSFWCC